LTFTYLKLRVCPEARLLLVGSSARMQVYLDYLHALVKRLALEDVVFTGHVSDRALMAYYRSASVYLSMSEHEGFGVPLLESMHFGVPVVAYKAAAVPETLGDSGVLITQKVYSYIAELLGILIADQELRQKIIAGQRERLKYFTPDRIQERLRILLHELA
jgi:L-malate glycosyltransferase